MKIFIISLIILLYFHSDAYNSEKITIILKPDKSIEFVLMGFNGFDSYIIKQAIIDSGSQVKFSADYQGLALLIFQEGQQYPVIISKTGEAKNDECHAEDKRSIQRKLIIHIHNPDMPPDIKYSPENKFLYEWLSAYMLQERTILSLQEKQYKKDEPDTLIFQLKKEQRKIQDQKQNHIEALSNPEFQYAKTLLKARLLNESTYKIITIGELNAKKEAYHQFIDENYEILYHSDMLIELAKQYFMMHEYVSWVKEDISLAKTHYQNAVVAGVGEWVKILQNRIPAEKVIEFCAELYYNRNMVTLATHIFDNFRNKFVTKNIEISFLPAVEKRKQDRRLCTTISLQFPDFDFLNNETRTIQNTGLLISNKIIAITSDNSIFSKAETISLARHLADSNLSIPVIIAPVEGLSEKHFEIDRLFAGYFCYMYDEKWQKKYLNDETGVPLFFLLDENNKVIKVSNDRKEIVNACQ